MKPCNMKIQLYLCFKQFEIGNKHIYLQDIGRCWQNLLYHIKLSLNRFDQIII